MIINCRRFLRNLLISELNYELIQVDAECLKMINLFSDLSRISYTIQDH
jgi:hypothetical protein